jgi:hypothetical protein
MKKKLKTKRIRAQVAECFSSKLEVLSSIPTITKKQTTTTKHPKKAIEVFWLDMVLSARVRFPESWLRGPSFPWLQVSMAETA